MTTLNTKEYLVKNKDLFSLSSGLQSVSNLSGAKFAYAVARNAKYVQEEIDALLKANVETEAFRAFTMERIKLCESHSVKDEAGKPKTINNGTQYDIPGVNDKDSAFNVALAALNEKHKEAIDSRLKQDVDYQALLETPVREDFKLHQVSLSAVPEAITTAQMNKILPMVSE